MAQVQIVPVKPEPTPKLRIEVPGLSDWPFGTAEAKRRQAGAGEVRKVIDLGDDVELELVRVPAGRFVMGDTDGNPDEQPLTAVKIDRAFWMSKFEVTNALYARFDPSHDSK